MRFLWFGVTVRRDGSVLNNSSDHRFGPILRPASKDFELADRQAIGENCPTIGFFNGLRSYLYQRGQEAQS